METEYNLWYSKSTDNSYFLGEPNCSYCHQQIYEQMIFEVWWAKSKHDMNNYCLSCIKELPKPKLSLVFERRMCLIINDEEELPPDAAPIFVQPPQLGHGKGVATWQIGEIMKNSEAEIIDKTRLAGRPNCTFIGLDESKDIIPVSELQDSNIHIPQETSPLLIANQRAVKKIEQQFQAKNLTVKHAPAELYLPEEKEIDINAFFDEVKNSTLIDSDDKGILLLEEDKDGN